MPDFPPDFEDWMYSRRIREELSKPTRSDDLNRVAGKLERELDRWEWQRTTCAAGLFAVFLFCSCLWILGIISSSFSGR